MVKITIENKEVEVPQGTTDLEAARTAYIHIPTLCYHPELCPYGCCRLCLVEVEGARTLQLLYPAEQQWDGCANDTPPTMKPAKFVLKCSTIERKHFCPNGQVSGGTVNCKMRV